MMRRALAVAALLCASSRFSTAQTITVSGSVLHEGDLAPITGAIVRVTGFGATAQTGRDGRFRINVHSPGRQTLIAQAVGYRPRVVEGTFVNDTTIVIKLERLPTELDTVRTIGGTVTISGHVRDAETHARVLYANATALPSGQSAAALSGTFRIADVPAGQIVVVVAGFHHLPATISFFATRDTSFDVDLAIDSVALRMTAHQVTRLAQRARAVPLAQQTVTGDDARMSGAMTVAELVNRRLQMIRAYSSRYVASLAGERALARIVYLPIGLQPVCE